MTWILPRLNRRVQVLQPTQKPNDEGGFDFTFGNPFGSGFEDGPFDYFLPLKTVWMGLVSVGENLRGSQLKYVRGEQVNETVTHEFICRYLSVAKLGRAFDKGFDTGFKNMGDLTPLKKDHFLFLLDDSSGVLGRLFRIDGIRNVKENDEFLSITAEEYEERGSGYEA